MRILCLDPGSRMIGAALSDEGGSLAKELGSYPNNRDFWPTLSKIIHDEEIKTIVVGRARQLDGGLTNQSKINEKFAARITAETGLTVALEDESASSAEAAERLRRAGADPEEIRERIHSMAAVVILEGYLASQAA